MNKKIEIFDSTLRDGAQGMGISYSVMDKIEIIKILDDLGVDYIEAGNPVSNPKDKELFDYIRDYKPKNAKLAAFGSTCRKNTLPQDDANLKALLDAEVPVCVIFGKSWLLHVTTVIETTAEENLRMIHDSCKYLKSRGKEVIFDAEHFFDGFKNNREYAMSSLKAAIDGGADTVCLCDTNGGIFPTEAVEIFKYVKEHINVPVSVHFHNDCSMAVASSVMCARAGADQIQGTFLGIGERCGNANLSTIIANLQIKLGFDCIPQEKLKTLTTTAKKLASVDNSDLDSNMPYVGDSAFAHKAGMHAAGVIKNSRSFEHIDPYLVGNQRRFPTSEISGRAVIFERIHEIFPEIHQDSDKCRQILTRIKYLESIGYQFEGADASFELLVRRELGLYKPYFDLISYKIYTGHEVSGYFDASAVVKIGVGDSENLMAAEGNGPVNALDKALRKALEDFYPVLSDVKLTDYKVRVLESGSATASKVRVFITSTDGKRIFTTMGVSEDVVDASWKALEDSINYVLLKKIG